MLKACQVKRMIPLNRAEVQQNVTKMYRNDAKLWNYVFNLTNILCLGRCWRERLSMRT